MPIRRIIVAAVLLGFFSAAARAADGADPVAAQYQFAGAGNLARNTNFYNARRIFGSPSSAAFLDLVLDRFAGIFWNNLQLDPAGHPLRVLRPLLDDVLRNESVGSFGGNDREHLDFVLAVHLDAARAQVWRQNLGTALRGQGEPFSEEGFMGVQWSRPAGNSFRLIQARDWVVAARGDDLASVRARYLHQIQNVGRPAPALTGTWFETDTDWPRLAEWIPLGAIPLKPARTKLELTVKGGRFHVAGQIIYPESVPWHPSPGPSPKGLVREPLASFTTGQDVEPFLRSDQTLAAFGANPFTGEFFCWALGEMPFESYAVWPVRNPAQTLATEAPRILGTFNPRLQSLDRSHLNWMQRSSQIIWSKASFMAPALLPARDGETDYLMAQLFPLSDRTSLVPADLWRQFEGRSDLVYYDWERSGMRLGEWRLLCELLPVLPPVTPEKIVVRGSDSVRPPFVIVDSWLAGLAPFLGNTVTQVTRTSSNEFALRRSSGFVFTGFELVWLSHWLTDTPSGPVNMDLLPRARMSGPGLPSR